MCSGRCSDGWKSIAAPARSECEACGHIRMHQSARVRVHHSARLCHQAAAGVGSRRRGLTGQRLARRGLPRRRLARRRLARRRLARREVARVRLAWLAPGRLARRPCIASEVSEVGEVSQVGEVSGVGEASEVDEASEGRNAICACLRRERMPPFVKCHHKKKLRVLVSSLGFYFFVVSDGIGLIPSATDWRKWLCAGAGARRRCAASPRLRA